MEEIAECQSVRRIKSYWLTDPAKIALHSKEKLQEDDNAKKLNALPLKDFCQTESVRTLSPTLELSLAGKLVHQTFAPKERRS